VGQKAKTSSGFGKYNYTWASLGATWLQEYNSEEKDKRNGNEFLEGYFHKAG